MSTATETHPFAPFLPPGARVLFLGSFPPPQRRWCMDFYYPNFINDFWRIMGAVFFGDRDRFVLKEAKRFDKEGILAFCRSEGIALFDTATEVRRLKDNASDAFLEVVRPTDIAALIGEIPACRAVVTTGERATGTLVSVCACEAPPVGGHVPLTLGTRTLRFYRMPSTSRAYPLPFDKKTAAYRQLFEEIGINVNSMNLIY